MKKIFPLSILILCCMTTFAQKQTFDVLTYSVPQGWQQKQNDGVIQLLVSDGKTGAYAMVVITKAVPSTASANENFHNQWAAAIKGQIQLDSEPAMQPPSNGNGWDIVTGSAGYTDNMSKGNVALLSATGAGKTVTVVVMTNSKQYETGLTSFLNSLELARPAQSETNNTVPVTKGATGKSSVVGLWCDNHLETSGYFNGFPQYSGGYFRREYLFKEDGTYVFRLKDWSTLLKDILFVYESGTYVVQGNRLIIIPNQGRGEWWSKKDNNTKLWGNRLKASDYKLEKTSYTFEIKYYSGTDNYSLMLNPEKNTERDGTYNNQNAFSYLWRKTGESILDNPPGFRTDH